MLEQSLFFNKVAGLRPTTLLKNRLWQLLTIHSIKMDQPGFFYSSHVAIVFVYIAYVTYFLISGSNAISDCFGYDFSK